jgi:hypothetical protein
MAYSSLSATHNATILFPMRRDEARHEPGALLYTLKDCIQYRTCTVLRVERRTRNCTRSTITKGHTMGHTPLSVPNPLTALDRHRNSERGLTYRFAETAYVDNGFAPPVSIHRGLPSRLCTCTFGPAVRVVPPPTRALPCRSHSAGRLRCSARHDARSWHGHLTVLQS